MAKPTLKPFTVFIAWWTGQEWSYHFVKVSSVRPIVARYEAIVHLRNEFGPSMMEPIGDNEYHCQAIFAGHLKNLWKAD